MRVVVQKRVVQVIQPEVVRYMCDGCGEYFEKGEKKETRYSDGKQRHYHKKCGGDKHSYCNACGHKWRGVRYTCPVCDDMDVGYTDGEEE